MEAAQSRYDMLITSLLPLHKGLLCAGGDIEKLKVCIHEIKELVSEYDYNKADQLRSILNRLLMVEISGYDQATAWSAIDDCRNEAVGILTRFFIEMDPKK